MDFLGPVIRLNEEWPYITQQNWHRIPNSDDRALWQHGPTHAIYQVGQEAGKLVASLTHVCDHAAIPSVADQQWYGAAAIVLEGLSRGFDYWSVRFVGDDTPPHALPPESDADQTEMDDDERAYCEEIEKQIAADVADAIAELELLPLPSPPPTRRPSVEADDDIPF